MGDEEKGKLRLIFGRCLSKRTEHLFFLGQRKNEYVVFHLSSTLYISCWEVKPTVWLKGLEQASQRAHKAHQKVVA